MHPVHSIAAIYATWLHREGITAHQAAARLGISSAASYEYVNGTSVPPQTRIVEFASKLGLNPADLAKAAIADRKRLKRSRSRAVSA